MALGTEPFGTSRTCLALFCKRSDFSDEDVIVHDDCFGKDSPAQTWRIQLFVLVKHPKGCGLKVRSRGSDVRISYLFLPACSCDTWSVGFGTW